MAHGTRSSDAWAGPTYAENVFTMLQDKYDPHHLRDLSPANELVLKTMEIISYFKPKYWFIENPQAGCLKHQDFMIGLPFHDVDYCMYGYGARKRTRIWTNYKDFEGKMCDKSVLTTARIPAREKHRVTRNSPRTSTKNTQYQRPSSATCWVACN